MTESRISPARGARDLAAALLRSVPAGWLVGVLERLDRDWPPDRVAILTYHRVDHPRSRPDLYPGLISCTPEEFERQLGYLAHRANVVSIDDLLGALRGTFGLPNRAVLITFDDAYADFAEHAWPVLRRLGLPATLFVPTAFPGDASATFWWDRLYAALTMTRRRTSLETPFGPLALASQEDRQAGFLRLRDGLKAMAHGQAMAVVDRIVNELDVSPARPAHLDWSALERLAAEGVRLAPHSRSHALLDRLAADALPGEIGGSVADLAARVREPAPVFAFPSGSHDATVVAAVAAAGLEAALTTRRGVNDLHRTERFRLRRINVGQRTDRTILAAQLLSPVAWTQREPRLVARRPPIL